MNASIKLLLIVREPVTRAISDYTQLRSHAATAPLPLANSPHPQQQAYHLSTQSKFLGVQLENGDANDLSNNGHTSTGVGNTQTTSSAFPSASK